MVALAAAIDDDITAFARKLAGQEISPAGELRVTTSDTLLVHLLTPLFARFRSIARTCGSTSCSATRRSTSPSAMPTSRSAPPTTRRDLVGRRVARIAWALYGDADRSLSRALSILGYCSKDRG